MNLNPKKPIGRIHTQYARVRLRIERAITAAYAVGNPYRLARLHVRSLRWNSLYSDAKAARVVVSRSCTYTVEGRGEFPFDMLRRDCSYPNSEQDSTAIGRVMHLIDAPRRVTLHAPALRYPNDARWASFGWRVIGATERTERADGTEEVILTGTHAPDAPTENAPVYIAYLRPV